MSSSSTDKQHYVPQFLLKRFADNSSYTYVWDKETNAILPRTYEITEFAYSRDLYTAPADRTLQNSEVKASRIIRKKLRPEGESSWEISTSEWNILTRFVSLLVIRSPKVEAMMQRLKESLTERIERLPPDVLVNVKGISVPTKSVRLADIARNTDPFNEVLADGPAIDEGITARMRGMRAQHMICPEGTAYIISDNPAWPCEMDSGPLIFLPLSPRNGLVFFEGMATEDVVSTLGVNLFNALQIHGGIRYAFSPDKEVLQQAGKDSFLL